MSRKRQLAIALDSEFLKTHGHVFASTVAFVAFSLKSFVLQKKSGVGNIIITGGESYSKIQPRVTIFGAPIILSLEPAEVMNRADVLPCGHSLGPFLRATFVGGEKLKKIQQRYVEEFNNLYSERNKRLTGVYTQHLGFDSLCPHTIPNIRRGNETWFYAIYASPVGSKSFSEAAAGLNYLYSYGKGRCRERSLSFLLRRQPRLLQELLRASFSTAEQWCAWLRRCEELAESELNRVTAEHRRLSSSTFSFESFLTMRECDGVNENMVQLKVCKTMEELSYELNYLWCSLLKIGVHDECGGRCTKFYCYGNVDAKAIQNTLRFSCFMKLQNTRESTKKKIELASSHSIIEREQDSATPSDVFSGKLLASPYGAKVVDITHHPLFAASGFCTSPKVVPALEKALQKVSAVDEVATRLHAKGDHHNPIWDAKALACVVTACGIGLS